MATTNQGVSFQQTLAWLATELMFGRAHFNLMRGMRKADQFVLETAPTFFSLIEGAVADCATLSLARIFDRHTDSISIHSLLALALSSAAAFEYGTEVEVRTAVAEAQIVVDDCESAMRALRTRRNKSVAHSDRGPMLHPDQYVEDGRISYSQMDELFAKLGKILDKMSILHAGRSMPLTLPGADDYKHLLAIVANAKRR